jgi:hypothetical protein
MDNTAAAVAPPVDIEKYVERFIKLRDKIKAIGEKHKAELAPYEEAKKQLEAIFADHLSRANVTSSKTAAGTVMALDRASATIEDTDAFRSFVVNNGEWDLADMRANTPAVEKFLEDQQALPPGVKMSRFRTISVRRA